MQILVAKEKHDKRYFLAPDRDALGRIAVKLLRERSDEGWFQSAAEVNSEKSQEIERFKHTTAIGILEITFPGILDYTEEKLDELPDGIKDTAVQAREKFAAGAARIERNFADEVKFAEELEKLLASAEPDLKVAYALLSLRSDAEYEGFTLTTLEEV